MSLIVGMFSAMAALVVASIWNQHREAARLRSELTRQLERFADSMREEFREHRHLNEQGHDEATKRHDDLKHTLEKVVDSLADARERLARIEGRLEITAPDSDSGSEAA